MIITIKLLLNSSKILVVNMIKLTQQAKTKDKKKDKKNNRKIKIKQTLASWLLKLFHFLQTRPKLMKIP